MPERTRIPGRDAAARLAALAAGMSLRARLLVVTVALATGGLAIAGVATYGALRSFLLDRVNAQLVASEDGALHAADGDLGGRGHPGELPQGVIVALYGTDGSALGAVGTGANLFDPSRTGYVDRDLPGLGEYRLRYTAGVQHGPGGPEAAGTPVQLVVGVPLADVHTTLARLVLIELLVGLVAVGGIAGGGLWLVRVGLRPLAGIERTAATIASGDLSGRVAITAPRSEVGRLGASLNTMLATIEEAFDERRAAEARLRQFVADASHELQTPLTSVRGYAELFRRGALDDAGGLADAMRRIESEAGRMGVLVDDLLLLARFDQGRPVGRDEVDLARAVRELAADAGAIEPDRPITVVAPERLTVPGDEVRLRQVIANLLGNVRTHTPPGSPVTVTLSGAGDGVTLEVADRGPGIGTGDEARLFERFFRADPSRTRASGGTGLGLSIVAAIVAAHGGEVTAANRPGGGAAFRVTLPVADRAVDATPAVASDRTPVPAG